MRLEYLGRLLVLNYFDLPVHIRDHQGLPDLPYTLVRRAGKVTQSSASIHQQLLFSNRLAGGGNRKF